MTTLQDIADRMGISKGTVSKALNGAPDISETLQTNVLETAVEMGYTKPVSYTHLDVYKRQVGFRFHDRVKINAVNA